MSLATEKHKRNWLLEPGSSKPRPPGRSGYLDTRPGYQWFGHHPKDSLRNLSYRTWFWPWKSACSRGHDWQVWTCIWPWSALNERFLVSELLRQDQTLKWFSRWLRQGQTCWLGRWIIEIYVEISDPGIIRALKSLISFDIPWYLPWFISISGSLASALVMERWMTRRDAVTHFEHLLQGCFKLLLRQEDLCSSREV